MILQVITPEKETFDLTVSLPESYLGKEVHCLFYIEEEAKNVSLKSPTVKKPSEFFGILSTEEGDQFNKHIQKLRNEWDRSI